MELNIRQQADHERAVLKCMHSTTDRLDYRRSSAYQAATSPFSLRTEVGLSSPTYAIGRMTGCLPELSLGDGQGKAHPLLF